MSVWEGTGVSACRRHRPSAFWLPHLSLSPEKGMLSIRRSQRRFDHARNAWLAEHPAVLKCSTTKAGDLFTSAKPSSSPPKKHLFDRDRPPARARSPWDSQAAIGSNNDDNGDSRLAWKVLKIFSKVRFVKKVAYRNLKNGVEYSSYPKRRRDEKNEPRI